MIRNVKVKKISATDNVSVRSIRIETDLGTVETPFLSLTSTDINALIDVPTTIDIKDDIVVLTNVKWLSEKVILNKEKPMEYVNAKIDDLKQKLSGDIKILIPFIQPGHKFISSLGKVEKINFIHKAVEYQHELEFSDVVIPDMGLAISDYNELLDQLTKQYQDVNLIPIIRADNKQYLSSIIQKGTFNTILILLGAKDDLVHYRTISTNLLKYEDEDVFFLGVSNTRSIRIPKSALGIADLVPVQIFIPFCGIDSSVVLSTPHTEPKPKDINERYLKLKSKINRLQVLNPITFKYEKFVELKDRLNQYVEIIEKYVRVDDDEILKYDILPNLSELYEIPAPNDTKAIETYEKKLDRITKLFRVVNLAMLETEYNQLIQYIKEENIEEYLRKRKFINELFKDDITKFLR